MFSSTARLYDLIYSRFKNYGDEVDRIAVLLRELHPAAHALLDVGCGTGEHARLLRERYGYAVGGIDLQPEFVEIARAKNPAGEFAVADMVEFDLGRRFDAVLCLFSSIGYVRTLENARRALACFRRHVKDGGVAIVEPWFAPGVLEDGYVGLHTGEGEGVTICRMSHTEVEGALSRLRFEYLIGSGTGIERASEVHELGLFTTAELRDCFEEAGFDVTYDGHGLTGRGLFVGRAGKARDRADDPPAPWQE